VGSPPRQARPGQGRRAELRLALGAHQDALEVIVVCRAGFNRAADGLEGVQDRALVGTIAFAVVLEDATLPEAGEIV